MGREEGKKATYSEVMRRNGEEQREEAEEDWGQEVSGVSVDKGEERKEEEGWRQVKRGFKPACLNEKVDGIIMGNRFICLECKEKTEELKREGKIQIMRRIPRDRYMVGEEPEGDCDCERLEWALNKDEMEKERRRARRGKQMNREWLAELEKRKEDEILEEFMKMLREKNLEGKFHEIIEVDPRTRERLRRRAEREREELRKRKEEEQIEEVMLRESWRRPREKRDDLQGKVNEQGRKMSEDGEEKEVGELKEEVIRDEDKKKEEEDKEKKMEDKDEVVVARGVEVLVEVGRGDLGKMEEAFRNKLKERHRDVMSTIGKGKKEGEKKRDNKKGYCGMRGELGIDCKIEIRIGLSACAGKIVVNKRGKIVDKRFRVCSVRYASGEGCEYGKRGVLECWMMNVTSVLDQEEELFT
nr:PREDICTED: uncharacterized protein KIAA1211 homolog [Megachile rotundata]